MISLQNLPDLNALLNTLALTFLSLGFVAIKKGKKEWHRRFMVSALAVSALFLTSYLTYHFHFGHKVFPPLGWIKKLYLAILIPHVILAIIMIPLILLTFYFAFSKQWVRHKKMARITLPIWMFVSCTGVIVYFFLEVFYFV